MAIAADPVIEANAAEEKEIMLPAVKVKAARDKKSRGYVADTSTAGTKTDTPLIETPQSISIITSEQIAAQNDSTLAQTLRYTPGVQSEPFGFEPRMTQIRMRGFDATETGLYQDGLKLVNPGFAVSYNLEPYGAERVEVLRGPASVLYPKNRS